MRVFKSLEKEGTVFIVPHGSGEPWRWNESQARHELLSLEQDRAWMEAQLITWRCSRWFPEGFI